MSQPSRRAAWSRSATACPSGVRDDASGRAVANAARQAGFEIARREVVPDERPVIERLLTDLADRDEIALVTTTGGTGFGPRDVTPEATHGGHRPRGARPGRGDARRRPCVDADGRPVPRRGGQPRLDADREPPREREGRRREPGRHPSGAAPRARPAGRTDRPRPGRCLGRRRTLRRSGRASAVHRGRARCRRGAGEEVVLATAVRAEGARRAASARRCCSLAMARSPERSAARSSTPPPSEAARGALASGRPGTRGLRARAGVDRGLPRAEPATAGAGGVLRDAGRAAMLMRWAHEVGFDPFWSSREPSERPRRERVVGPRRDRVPKLPDGADVFAVHTDHDAPGVAESMAALLRADAAFIGVMGSDRHVGPHVEALRSRGSATRISRASEAPLGLDIGGRSAEEIALSILAGVVAARHGRDGGGWTARVSCGGGGVPRSGRRAAAGGATGRGLRRVGQARAGPRERRR